MSEPLLQIRNHHSEACGDPPIINGDDPGKAELRGGDIGWNSVHEVREGKVAELVLGREELVWLQACWKAAKLGRRA